MERPRRLVPAAGAWRRASIAAALAIAGATLGSCTIVTSEHALATPADTLFDESLRGRWRGPTSPTDSLQGYFLAIDPEHGSTLAVRDTTGRIEQSVRLVRLGGHWFGDLQLTSWISRRDPDAGKRLDRLLSLHTIVRLDVAADTMRFRYLDEFAVSAYCRNDPAAPHLARSRGDDLTGPLTSLTARTPDLRKIIARIADAESLYTSASASLLYFVRQR